MAAIPFFLVDAFANGPFSGNPAAVCPLEVWLPEDPVTGSAHSMLIPFWAKRLGKTVMTAHQLSPRGGELRCQLKGDRVLIGGRARTYLEGHIFLD